MRKWHLTPASPLDPEHPLPHGTQTWEFGVARVEPVAGLPGAASRALTEAQQIENRKTDRLRRLGDIRPGQSLPRARR
jgi:hypothetical protein